MMRHCDGGMCVWTAQLFYRRELIYLLHLLFFYYHVVQVTLGLPWAASICVFLVIVEC